MVMKKAHTKTSFATFLKEYKASIDWDNQKSNMNFTATALKGELSPSKYLFNDLANARVMGILLCFIKLLGFEYAEVIETINEKIVIRQAANHYHQYLKSAKFVEEENLIVDKEYFKVMNDSLKNTIELEPKGRD